MLRRGLLFAGTTALSACTAIGPDYQAPEIALTPNWREPASSSLSSAPAELAQWWQKLGDPELGALIERALSQGLDVREALARVAEARALRGVAAADRLPTVDSSASYRLSGESDNTPLGGFVPDNGIFSVGLDASWELDLWGRVRRSIEAADAELAAMLEGARDAHVMVAAEVALRYVELRTFQRRLAIARGNVDLQQETLGLVQGRLDAGLVGESDVAQARTNLASTRSRLPALEGGLRAAENRLCVLLGVAPGALASELSNAAPIPVPPLAIAVGVPADLLRRRADVRRAERALAAETARIGVTEGDLYPRLALNGNLGLAAEELSDLTESASGAFGIGPSLRWNVFDSGRIRRRVAAQEARTEQALVTWERSVLLALEEAENAMTSFVREQERRASLREAAEQARKAVELARAQYSEGLSDFQTVLVSERSLADLEDELATSDSAVTASAVRLYKALGGGWEEGAEPRGG